MNDIDLEEELAVLTEGDSCPRSAASEGERKTHRPQKMKENLIVRLKRIEGQVRGVKGMIERDTYCDDVLNQIAAIQSALSSVARLLLENHLKSCVKERILKGDETAIDEVLVTMNKLFR